MFRILSPRHDGVFDIAIERPDLGSAFEVFRTDHWQVEMTDEFAVWRDNVLVARVYVEAHPLSGKPHLNYQEIIRVQPSTANRFACGD